MIADQGQLLRSVFLGIMLVGAPMAELLTVPVMLAMLLICVWVLLMSYDRAAPPAQWLRVLFSFGLVGLLVVSYGTIFGLIPGTVMVIMLCILKIFEIRGRRDISLIVFLCLFLTATNFFHSQSFWIAGYMFVVVLYLVSLMVMVNDRLQQTALPQRLAISFRHIAWAIPFMLILFLLFPRLPGPLWGLPDDAHSARTGVPDELTPGSISNLISSSAVAFRVSFDTDIPNKKDLYWRGLVLQDYDGKTWRRSDAPFYTYPNVELLDDSRGLYSYTITLEPTMEHWLYTLETPVIHDSAYKMTRELQLYSRTNISSVVRYETVSSTIASDRSLFEEEREKNLALPEGSNPRTDELGRQLWQQHGGHARSIINSALTMFREQSFFYTLEPPLLGENAVDEFLFETRRGFCEHYSAAFVTLMRSASVPSRVVVGYQGGEINPGDDYMVVRQSDAHAWAEVWVEGKWRRVDPTAQVSPDRIERGVQHAGLESGRLPMLLASNSKLLRELWFQWDSLQYAWNQWVIGFDNERQKRLFENLGIEDVSYADLIAWLVISMTVMGAVAGLWLIYLKRPRRDPVDRYYALFVDKMRKRGTIKTPYEGAREFSERVLAEHPELTPVKKITRLYLRMRYGGKDDESTLRSFIREVRRFRAA